MINPIKLKCYLDSNTLVYYKNEDSPYNSYAVRIITQLVVKEAALFISTLTLDEFLFQIRYLKLRQTNNLKIVNKLLLKILREILSLPSLSIINAPTDKNSQFKVVRFMEKYNLRPRDAYHLLTMRQNKIGAFATFDSDFSKVFANSILEKIS